MIYSTNDETTAARCLGLIERNAAKFMRSGGGFGLSRGRAQAPAITMEQRNQMLALARDGKMCVTDIARQVGVSQSAAFRIVEQAGIKTPDGRRQLA